MTRRRFLHASERSKRIATGLIAFLFIAAVTTLGITVRVGGNPLPGPLSRFAPDYYQIEASFTSAGQGLQHNSDVKVRSLDIGRVRTVRIEEGRAVVRMDIKKNDHVPRTAVATIRPKTLFGEKYIDIDPGPDEAKPETYLKDEERLDRTVGGFELEKVLVDLYPILKAIDPKELMTVISELARGAEATAPQVNKVIGTFSQVLNTQAEVAGSTDQFLQDFARLAEALAAMAPDIDALSETLNATLPDFNARADQLRATLEQVARFSADLNDLLNDNEAFFETAIVDGGKTLQLLDDKRNRIGPLLTGLRQFFQVLGSVGRIPYGDGTVLAAVKFVYNLDCPEGRSEGCGESVEPAAQTAARRSPQVAGKTPVPPGTASNVGAVLDLVEGVLKR